MTQYIIHSYLLIGFLSSVFWVVYFSLPDNRKLELEFNYTSLKFLFEDFIVFMLIYLSLMFLWPIALVLFTAIYLKKIPK